MLLLICYLVDLMSMVCSFNVLNQLQVTYSSLISCFRLMQHALAWERALLRLNGMYHSSQEGFWSSFSCLGRFPIAAQHCHLTSLNFRMIFRIEIGHCQKHIHFLYFIPDLLPLVPILSNLRFFYLLLSLQHFLLYLLLLHLLNFKLLEERVLTCLRLGHCLLFDR